MQIRMGGGEITGELDADNIPTICVEALGGATSVDVGGEIRWIGKKSSSAGSSEVACGGGWVIPCGGCPAS